jgi:hypothetical protein
MESSNHVSDIGPRNGRHRNPISGLVGFRDFHADSHADFHADIKAAVYGRLMWAIYLI